MALMLACLLVWLVTVVRAYWNMVNPVVVDQNLTYFGQLLEETFENETDPRKVMGAAEALEFMEAKRYAAPGKPAVYVQISRLQGDRAGEVIYRAKGTPVDWSCEVGQLFSWAYGQSPLRVTCVKSGIWHVTIGVAKPDIERILGEIARFYSIELLIAFPFLLVPVWIAVSMGLRPLRQLSTKIAARGPDELNPVGVVAEHAELKPLVLAIDTLLLQLRSKVQREHSFVQEAAHELRTPMAVISAQAHALAGAQTPAEMREAEQHLDVAIARASHLIEQLLQLARLEGGEQLPRTPTDVAGLVRRELSVLVPQALARQQDLSLEAPDALTVDLALHPFLSVLHNLVGNALRYVPAKGRIVVSLAMFDGWLQLKVADDGPGIPAALREQVFERFVRGSGVEASGVGLGLAIVKQAVTTWGGRVWLGDGLDGRGCAFTVQLPLTA